MTNLRLFLLDPPIIFAARVNQGPGFDNPLDEITYDTVTVGSYTQVYRGMTVLLGTTPGGDDLGRQRIRKSPTSTLLRVGRSSRGNGDGQLNPQDNAYITVLWDHRVWAKIPYIDPDGEVFKDSDVPPDDSNNYGLYPHPVANASAGFAGTIDPITGLVTVDFDATNSFQFDSGAPTNISPVTDVLWTISDGTITVGSTTSLEMTATFSAGFRYVYLTVTGDNGMTHQKAIPVYARDPASDTSIKFQVSGHSIKPDGQTVTVRILQDIPRATYPDGTLAMIWDDDLQTQFALRSHMLFVGWHQTDEGGVRAERTGNLRNVTLTLVDVVGRLRTLPGFPQRLEAGSPTKWQYTTYPNALYYLYYILYWHSTALEVADLLVTAQYLGTYEFKVLGSDEANLYEQANRVANQVTPDHHLTCNQKGQLNLVIDPLIENVDNRSSTIADSIDDSEWIEVRYTYNRPPRVYQLRTYAILSDSTTITSVACLAPGTAPGQGEQYIETSERITYATYDLTVCEGNRFARLNAPYGFVTITLPFDKLNNSFDPADLGWVRLTVSSENQPQRTLPFANQRGIVHEVNVTYDYRPTGLVRTATLTWECETSGPRAEIIVLETA